MRNKSMVALAVAAFSSAVFVATNAAAVQPQPRSDGAALVTPMWIPQGVGNQTVTVVVQMTGESVAEQQADAGRRLSKQEKDTIKQQIKAQQDARQGRHRGGWAARWSPTTQSAYQRHEGAHRPRQCRAARHAARRDRRDSARSSSGRATRTACPSSARPSRGRTSGLHGEHVKVAIIDTGIDYTHANFAGPGTIAAYQAAHANETLPADPTLFGPGAPRVKGGTDLVGDSYNAGLHLGRLPADAASRIPTRSTATATARTSRARPAATA